MELDGYQIELSRHASGRWTSVFPTCKTCGHKATTIDVADTAVSSWQPMAVVSLLVQRLRADKHRCQEQR